MTRVNFFKRIIIVIYDGLLLVGVTMVAFALLFSALLLAPEGFASSTGGKVLKIIFLIATSFVFYGWFWTHGGQTLGMKVWNLYVVDRHGKFLTWTLAAWRYLAALVSWLAVASILWFAGVERWYFTLGLGFSWILVNQKKLAWHDILSGTQIWQTPKTKDAVK